jgi:hypothetical protein
MRKVRPNNSNKQKCLKKHFNEIFVISKKHFIFAPKLLQIKAIFDAKLLHNVLKFDLKK